jgi:hypothetical protein
MTNSSNPPRDDGSDALRQVVERAFSEAPMLYANGFINGLGLTDSYLVLQANGRSVAVINLSLSVAKSLGQGLLAMVAQHEQTQGRPVPTIEELQQTR